MRCIIMTPKVRYELDIKRAVTIIRGDSGSGKTLLCEDLAAGESSGTKVECERIVRVASSEVT